MKLRLAFLLFAAGLFHPVHAQVFTQFRQGDSIVAGAGCSMGFYRYYAFKPKDVTTYQHIAGAFGKDKFQAYCAGKPLPGINPKKSRDHFCQGKRGERRFV